MTTLEIIGKARARAKGLTRYFLGKPCSNGHIAERYTKSGACVQCSKARSQTPKAKEANAKRYKEKMDAMSPEEKFLLSEKRAEYRDNNRHRINEAAKQRRLKTKQTPEEKTLSAIRNRVYVALKGKDKSFNTIDTIGCTREELVSHLEKQFRDGMNWDNQGSRWHIDHIQPISKFDLSNEEEAKKANHYTNLRPLLWHENIHKSDKEDWSLEEYKKNYAIRYTHPWYTCESWER